MPRKSGVRPASGRTILLVDDDTEYLETTTMVLEREGHRVLQASSGVQALMALRQERIDLCLLDFVMPGMTGEEVVLELRTFDPVVQVVLQTGYASEQPPRELLRRLDIQGYFDKSEGPEKLLLWVDVGLKAAQSVQTLARSRQGLRYILDVTPELHKIQPLEHLLRGILVQISAFMGASSSFVAVLPEPNQRNRDPNGFVAIMDDDVGLVIKAGTGVFADKVSVQDCLPAGAMALVKDAIREAAVRMQDGSTVLPLRVGEGMVGVVYMDGMADDARDRELLQVFANQASVAIQNAQLYEMATLDPMTGVYVRRFFEQWLVRELRNAFRGGTPLSLIMLDLDDFKAINDTAGHLVGDQALYATGEALREAVRSGDVVGRFGGDEFAILLPNTDEEGARSVATRALQLLQASKIPTRAGEMNLAGSVGVVQLGAHSFAPDDLPRPMPPRYFADVARDLLDRADQALYRAKNAGKNRVEVGAGMAWRRPG